MELIIKPTSRCNFNCTFCSAKFLKIKDTDVVPDELKKVIKVLQPNRLIFTGGDSLLASPKYYNEILTLGDYEISLQSNLKDFYLHPEKWTEFLKNPRVDIGTSFHYGDTRKWDVNTPYTEDMFIKVIDKFNNIIGYKPSFIAVISNENEDRALDHLELAKKIGTTCRLNRLMPIGGSKEYYPLYKMIDIWEKILTSDLAKYLDSDKQFVHGTCCFNTNLLCESTIRAFWLKEDGTVYYTHCEDSYDYDFSIPVDEVKPEPKPTALKPNDLITKDCFSCPLCRLCNGCKLSRNVNKITPNFCEEMKKRIDVIEKLGWSI